MKENTREIKVKGYERKTKSGKIIKVEGYTRDIPVVPFSKAQYHFRKQSKKAQHADIKRAAKKTVLPNKIPKSYIKKGGTKQIDVHGIDDPEYVYGYPTVKIKSINQLRRLVKPVQSFGIIDGKSLYERHTKKILDDLKESDVKGLYALPKFEEKKKVKIRKINEYKAKELVNLNMWKWKQVDGKRKRVDDPHVETFDTKVTEGVNIKTGKKMFVFEDKRPFRGIKIPDYKQKKSEK
jgi:hypothetical protein